MTTSLPHTDRPTIYSRRLILRFCLFGILFRDCCLGSPPNCFVSPVLNSPVVVSWLPLSSGMARLYIINLIGVVGRRYQTAEKEDSWRQSYWRRRGLNCYAMAGAWGLYSSGGMKRKSFSRTRISTYQLRRIKLRMVGKWGKSNPPPPFPNYKAHCFDQLIMHNPKHKWLVVQFIWHTECNSLESWWVCWWQLYHGCENRGQS